MNFQPPFSGPPSLFFSYPSNIEIIFDFSDIITKIHPPFQNPRSALGLERVIINRNVCARRQNASEPFLSRDYGPNHIVLFFSKEFLENPKTVMILSEMQTIQPPRAPNCPLLGVPDPGNEP